MATAPWCTSINSICPGTCTGLNVRHGTRVRDKEEIGAACITLKQAATCAHYQPRSPAAAALVSSCRSHAICLSAGPPFHGSALGCWSLGWHCSHSLACCIWGESCQSSSTCRTQVLSWTHKESSANATADVLYFRVSGERKQEAELWVEHCMWHSTDRWYR